MSFQPATSGSKSATLQITSAGGSPRNVPLMGIGTCPVITVGGTLPGGRVSTAYAGIVTASGDPGPFTFALTTGPLPAGLALTPATGAVSGTPTTVGASTFTVLATSANGCTGSGSFMIGIAPPVLTASPSSVSFGIVAVPSSSTQAVTLTNNTAAPFTLTAPFAITGTHAAQFSAGAPAAATLAGGASTTVDVTFTPSGAGVKSATLTATGTSGGSVAVPLTGIGSAATALVISEFRTRGPSGGNDEFVEIYNNTNAAIDISNYTMRGSNGGGTNSIRATVPANTILPPHEHYLFVNTAAAGYSGAAPGNASYGTGVTDDGGVALADNNGTILDQAGMSTGSAYKEGATLTPLAASSVDRAYERKAGVVAGTLQDTDDNGPRADRGDHESRFRLRQRERARVAEHDDQEQPVRRHRDIDAAVHHRRRQRLRIHGGFARDDIAGGRGDDDDSGDVRSAQRECDSEERRAADHECRRRLARDRAGRSRHTGHQRDAGIARLRVGRDRRRLVVDADDREPEPRNGHAEHAGFG